MKRILPVIAALVILALLAALIGWGYYVSSWLGGGWELLTAILPYVVVGLIAVGGLTGVLMWLAFYSARHGYDDPYDVNKPGGGRKPR